MNDHIFVGSMPRSGTNWFLASLCNTLHPGCFKQRGEQQYRWAPGNGTPVESMGSIIGTHGPPPASKLFHYDQYIYLVGDPTLSIISHLGISTLNVTHLHHCGQIVPYPRDQVLHADVLNLESTFIQWVVEPRPFSRLVVKYEALETGEARAAVSRYLDSEIKFVPWRPRDS